MEHSPGATLVFETVAITTDGDDVAMVQHAVEDGGGGVRVAKDHAPFRYGAVAGDEEATALIAPRHQLEEQMGDLGLERQVAELIHGFAARWERCG